MLWIKLTVLTLKEEPLIFSISKNSPLPPSKAGNGKALITAKFIESTAVNCKR